MLVSPVLGTMFHSFAAFYSFAAAMGAAAILGVALSIGATVVVLSFAIGHISGGHINSAITSDASPRGRQQQRRGRLFHRLMDRRAGGLGLVCPDTARRRVAANGYGVLSMLNLGLISVVLIEPLLSAFLVFVGMGATSRRAPAGFAPIAIGARLRYTSWPSRSPTPRLTRRAAWATPWSPKARPIPGGVIGCSIARWLPGDGRRVRHFAPGAGPRGKEGA